MPATWSRFEQVLLAFAVLLLTAAWIWNIDSPLQGIHSIRQADTLGAARSYCVEHAEFLKPLIAHRGAGAGVNIGEFPVVSWLLSLPCQLRGEWDELRPKILALIFFLAAGVLWGLLWRRIFRSEVSKKDGLPLNPSDLLSWILFWIFPTYQLLHGFLPIPDSAALACIAAAGLCSWRLGESPPASRGRRWLLELLSVSFFVLGFAIRPYLIPLWLVTQRSHREKILSFTLCCAFYLAWYRWWGPTHSEFPYYATSVTPFDETLRQSGAILGALAELLLRDLTHVIALIPLLLVLSSGRRPPGFALVSATAVGSLLLVLVLRGPQILHHSYYLGAFIVTALPLLAWTWSRWHSRWRPWALSLFLLISVANTQHEFHRQGAARATEVRALLAEKNPPPVDKIAVYVGDRLNPPYLYWVQRTGWSFPAGEFKGLDSCPAGARWALYENAGRMAFETCQSANAPVPETPRERSSPGSGSPE